MKQVLLKVRQLAATDLIKVSFLNGISTVIRMMAGFVSTKVVASVVGPVGIALLGQLNNFVTIIQSIANGGITAGVTRYVSEHASNGESSASYIRTSFRITLFLSVVSGIVLFAGAGSFSQLVLRSPGHALVFRIAGLTIVFYALNALLLAIINGYKEYRLFVKANIVSSLVSVVFSVILALRFGLLGALISAVTYQSVVFLVTLYLATKTPWFNRSNFLGPFSGKAARSLVHFSLMAIASAVVVPLSQLAVRGFIVSELSVTDGGNWEGVNRISTMYLTVVISSLSVYYLPRLAEIKDQSELRREVYSVYQVMIPFLLVAAVCIYMFRDLIISILFTSEFTGMRSLFFFQLTGDLLKMCGWVMGYMMVAKAMTRTYISMELLNYSIFVVLSRILVAQYGVEGATIAYATGHFIYLLGMIIIFRKVLTTA